MGGLTSETLAHLRHELRTPVNHILGYSELLLESASERNLAASIPSLQRIQQGGRQLLEVIQTALTEDGGEVLDSGLLALRSRLREAAAPVLEMSSTLQETLQDGDEQTLADLDAISQALRNLLDFTVQERLPVRTESVSVAPKYVPQEQDPGQNPRGGKIIIADDDRSNRILLRRCLEMEGHQVFEAANGVEVLQTLHSGQCDLVLLDIVMPEMDGFQTLARIRHEPRWKDLPVIMISALDELGSVVHCIEMGAEDYLSKPFDRVLLRARIGASLEKKRLRDRERRKTKELEQTLQLLEKAQAQLALQASQDALTGLANRHCVNALLDQRTKGSSSFSVVYIDLNGFKKINDTYGHHAGDDLLREVGARLRTSFRASDLVGRWGGDEFVVVVDANLEQVPNTAARIANCLSRPITVGAGDQNHRVSVAAAVGVATWHPGDKVVDVFHRADGNMYRAKPQD
jgi:adenylate cyclase